MSNPKRTITLRGTKLRFHEQYDSNIKSSWMNKLIHNESSDQDEEDYSWLGPVPELEEWIGTRVEKGLLAIEYSIRNRKFQTAIKLLRDWYRRQKDNTINEKIDELANKAGTLHIHKLISDLIIAGASTVCYDGQYFFDTDHVTPGAENDTVQSNLLSKVLADLPTSNHGTAATAPSVEDAAYLIMNAIGTLYSFKDEFGSPTNQNCADFTVMCGTIPIYTAVQGAISKMNLKGGETNQLVNVTMNGAKLNIEANFNPRLSSLTTSFDILAADGAGKPFIVQEEEGPVVETLGEGSDYTFDNDAYKFGVKVKRNAAFGLWRKAVRVSLTQSS